MYFILINFGLNVVVGPILPTPTIDILSLTPPCTTLIVYVFLVSAYYIIRYIVVQYSRDVNKRGA